MEAHGSMSMKHGSMEAHEASEAKMSMGSMEAWRA
jgi:hypothetical protein